MLPPPLRPPRILCSPECSLGSIGSIASSGNWTPHTNHLFFSIFHYLDIVFFRTGGTFALWSIRCSRWTLFEQCTCCQPTRSPHSKTSKSRQTNCMCCNTHWLQCILLRRWSKPWPRTVGKSLPSTPHKGYSCYPQRTPRLEARIQGSSLRTSWPSGQRICTVDLLPYTCCSHRSRIPENISNTPSSWILRNSNHLSPEHPLCISRYLVCNPHSNPGTGPLLNRN